MNDESCLRMARRYKTSTESPRRIADRQAALGDSGLRTIYINEILRTVVAVSISTFYPGQDVRRIGFEDSPAWKLPKPAPKVTWWTLLKAFFGFSS